jgi:hypothetical protein
MTNGEANKHYLKRSRMEIPNREPIIFFLVDDHLPKGRETLLLRYNGYIRFGGIGWAMKGSD